MESKRTLKADSGADSKFVTFGTGRSSSCLRKYQKMQIKGEYHILQSIRHLWLILMPNGVIARGETRSKKSILGLGVASSIRYHDLGVFRENFPKSYRRSSKTICVLYK